MFRRLIGLIFILACLGAAVLVGYAYFSDLPVESGRIETPAVGVGFGD